MTTFKTLGFRAKAIAVVSINSVMMSCLLPLAVQAQNKSCEIEFKYDYDQLGAVGASNRELGPVSSLAVSPNGQTLVISTQTRHNSSARERRLQQQLIVLPIDNKIDNKDAQMLPTTTNITSVAFHPSGRFFAAAATGEIKLFKARDLKNFFKIPLKQIMVEKISFSPDGSYLLSLETQKSTGYKNIVLYSVNDQGLNLVEPFITETDKHYTAAVFHPNSKQLILGGISDAGEFVEVRSLQDRSTMHHQEISPRRAPDSGISALAISPDGKTIAVASRYYRRITVWKNGDFSEVKQFSNSNIIRDIAFSPNGKYLLTGEERLSNISYCDSPAKLWSLESGHSFALLELNKNTGEYSSQVQETVRSVLFSKDAGSIFLGSNGGYMNRLTFKDESARLKLSK
jgi:WD40 repeat protein